MLLIWIKQRKEERRWRLGTAVILGTQGGSTVWNINEISCVECGREVHWSKRRGREKLQGGGRMETKRENRVMRLGGGRRCYCTLDAGYTYTEAELTLADPSP